jgi:hypothetical protein
MPPLHECRRVVAGHDGADGGGIPAGLASRCWHTVDHKVISDRLKCAAVIALNDDPPRYLDRQGRRRPQPFASRPLGRQGIACAG